MLTTEQKLAILARANYIWERAGYSLKFLPTIEFNSRLRTTAGRCLYTLNKIDLNSNMDFQFLMEDTLPHELAHQIA